MKKMLDWLKRFIWISEIIFLAASTPHIATYFAHFDNPTDLLGQVYAWGVGYGLALLIDGVSFIVLMSMMFSVQYRRPKWLVGFLIFAMVLVSTLSWFINWQYDLVFASTTFAVADKIKVSNGMTIGSLNPLIGGAFPFLSVLYALVAKAIEVEEGEVNKEAMTPEQFEMEKTRIAQEQELKTLRNAQRSGKGLLSIAQETVMGRSTDAEELLNRTVSYLRDARDLLPIDQEERALQALSAYLHLREKAVQPVLIQARSILEREEHEESIRQAKLEEEARLAREQAEQEERLRLAKVEEEKRLRLEREAEEERVRREQAEKEERLRQVRLQKEEQRISQDDGSEEGLLKGLKGSDTVTIEVAAQVLGHEDTRYVVRLRNEETLKHKPKREDLITVASLRAYLAKHPKRTPLVAIRPNEEEHVEQGTEAIA